MKVVGAGAVLIFPGILPAFSQWAFAGLALAFLGSCLVMVDTVCSVPRGALGSRPGEEARGRSREGRSRWPVGE